MDQIVPKLSLHYRFTQTPNSDINEVTVNKGQQHQKGDKKHVKNKNNNVINRDLKGHTGWHIYLVNCY